MGLRVDIEFALAAAQDENDDVGAAALRLVQCAVRDRDRVAKTSAGGAVCEDAQIAQIVRQMIAQREASAAEYDVSGEPDLARREREEIGVLQSILPAPMSQSKVEHMAMSVIEAAGATGLKDLGRCLGEVKQRTIDPDSVARISAAVKQRLTAQCESD